MVCFKYKPEDEDFQRLTPLDQPYAAMARMVTAKDMSFRIGWGKFEKGRRLERTMIMDEVFYVVKGKLKYTVSTPYYREREPGEWIPEDPRNWENKEFEVLPGEAVFMGLGTRHVTESLEDTIIFYCAIPASAKGIDNYVLHQTVRYSDTKPKLKF
jgi:quercetin dioxygenase-like cupin family protein